MRAFNLKKTYKPVAFLGLILISLTAKSQFMPIVFDKTFGIKDNFNVLTPLNNGQIFASTDLDLGVRLLWLSPTGDINKVINATDGVTHIEGVVAHIPTGDIILAMSGAPTKEKKLDGRARIVRYSQDGKLIYTVKFAEAGSRITALTASNDGTVWVAGYQPSENQPSKQTFAYRISGAGNDIKQLQSNNKVCNKLLPLDDGSVFAAYSSESSSGKIVKFSQIGNKLFDTEIEGEGVQIDNLATDYTGSLLSIVSDKSCQRLIKVRPEGSIVFDKKLMETPQKGLIAIDKINGDMLVGVSGNSYSNLLKLRSDGTEIYRKEYKGSISAVAFSISNDAIVATYDEETKSGIIAKVGIEGINLFEKNVRDRYSNIKVEENGDIYFGGPETGRLTLISDRGEIVFDRLITQDVSAYKNITYQKNGDVIFSGGGNRLTKIGHGLIVNDIIVTEPISGHAMATFTVTLSGYQKLEGGAPSPVSVEYSIVKKGVDDNDIVPIKGILSFVPTEDGMSNFLVKQQIEVPIKADNLLENKETFTLRLSNPTNSYLIKPDGNCSIEDQPVIVRFIGSKDGYEAGENLVYNLGIFKTNGEPVTNSTGADITVEGRFGHGTADSYDIDMSQPVIVTIPNSKQEGKFEVAGIPDLRYEIPKSVVLEFDKISALSDVKIAIEGLRLNCIGNIHDQPAYVAISSLGDKSKIGNISTGLFKVELLRASDDKPLVNCSGGNVLISFCVDGQSTATKGADFVILNENDLPIYGDCQKSANNIIGAIINDKDKEQDETVFVKLTGVQGVVNAGKIDIHPIRNIASFVIKDNN